MTACKFGWHTTAIMLAALWLAPARASAQSFETDTGEVAVLGGGSFGIGAQPAVMGSAGISVSRYAMVLVDASYMPLGQHTIQPWPPQSTVSRSYLYDFGVDLHIRIPIKERWAPYGILGTGVLWNVIRQNTTDSHGVAVTRIFNQFNCPVHTGGGLRYYVKENWGVRSELRVIASKQTYTQLSFGVFYVTP